MDNNGDLRDVVTTTPEFLVGGGLLSAITSGIVSPKTKAALRGTQAGLRIENSSPTFWFCSHAAVNPREVLLVAFKVSNRRKERTFEIGKINLWAIRTGTPPKQLRDVRHEKVSAGVYKVTPQEALKKGEYGFYYAGMIFAFGVD